MKWRVKMTSIHQIESMTVKQLKAKLKTCKDPTRSAVATELIHRGVKYSTLSRLLIEAKKHD